MKAICFPRGNRPSFWAFCSSRLTFCLKWECWMILFTARAIFASCISKFRKSFPTTDREDFLSIQWTDRLHFVDPCHSFRLKMRTSSRLILECYLPKSKWMWSRVFIDLQLRYLLFFAITPQRSAETPPAFWNSQSTAFLQTSALEMCPYFARLLLRKRSLSLLLVELILSLLVSHNNEFLEKNFGANQM